MERKPRQPRGRRTVIGGSFPTEKELEWHFYLVKLRKYITGENFVWLMKSKGPNKILFYREEGHTNNGQIFKMISAIVRFDGHIYNYEYDHQDLGYFGDRDWESVQPISGSKSSKRGFTQWFDEVTNPDHIDQGEIGDKEFFNQIKELLRKGN